MIAAQHALLLTHWALQCCYSIVFVILGGVCHVLWNSVHQEKDMPNIAAVLKEEILRLARKEIRQQTSTLKRVCAQHRRDIAQLRRQLSDLQRKVAPLQEQVLKGAPAQSGKADGERLRFTAKGLRSHRRRLGLSAADYGRLVGVTGQTIYSWEEGTSRPRKSQLAHIASVRTVGKREAIARLEHTRSAGKRKPS
jgi:DNA-binding XRE family transcriptional regulator/uncharacterized coiled-coil protein SlyX